MRQRYWLGRLRAAAVLLALAVPACDAGGGARGEPSAAAPLAPHPAPALPVVLFLGDSLAAGYGLPAEESFPALVQERIEAERLGYRVVNAGVSGDTSAGGRRRIAWLLRQPLAVLVLALGGNDMLRGHDPDALRGNLRAIVEATRASYPEAQIVIAGMRAPPNLGPAYVARFEETFPELARESDAALIPFLLEGVATVPELNQPDGIHPTAAGQRIIAENVWRILGPILRARAGA